MKCFRVWFRDGSAMLVDAESEEEAVEKAENLADPHARATRTEDLD